MSRYRLIWVTAWILKEAYEPTNFWSLSMNLWVQVVPFAHRGFLSRAKSIPIAGLFAQACHKRKRLVLTGDSFLRLFDSDTELYLMHLVLLLQPAALNIWIAWFLHEVCYPQLWLNHKPCSRLLQALIFKFLRCTEGEPDFTLFQSWLQCLRPNKI